MKWISKFSSQFSHEFHLKTLSQGLQNDLKELTKRIESALHDLHAQQRQGMGWNNEILINQTNSLSILKDVTEDDQPFAKIGTVQSGSPADQAVNFRFWNQIQFFLTNFSFQGLKTDDLIVAMGTLRCSNVGNNGLNDVADLVRHSIDRPIPVCIRRPDSANNILMELILTPKKWPPGVGLLGCVLLPFDSIDRWISFLIWS